MQTWTVVLTGDKFAVTLNGELIPDATFDSADAACSNAYRRALTSTQHTGGSIREGDHDGLPSYTVDSKPLTNAEKQADRTRRRTEAARVAGYSTIDKLVAAILSGEAIVQKQKIT